MVTFFCCAQIFVLLVLSYGWWAVHGCLSILVWFFADGSLDTKYGFKQNLDVEVAVLTSMLLVFFVIFWFCDALEDPEIPTNTCVYFDMQNAFENNDIIFIYSAIKFGYSVKHISPKKRNNPLNNLCVQPSKMTTYILKLLLKEGGLTEEKLKAWSTLRFYG